MEVFIAQLISGIKLGSLYAVVVICYNLLILVTGVLHLGYASLLVLSMYAAWYVLGLTGDNIALGIIAAVVSGTLIGGITAPLFLPFIKRRAMLEALVISLALGIISEDIMSHWLNLGQPIPFPPSLLMEGSSIRFGLTVIRLGEVVTLAASIVIVFAFLYFLNKTKQGRVLRAVAQDTEVARFLGYLGLEDSRLQLCSGRPTGGHHGNLVRHVYGHRIARSRRQPFHQGPRGVIPREHREP